MTGLSLSFDLRAAIQAGRAGGTWAGATGIVSSAAADADGVRTVGYRVAADGTARVAFAASCDIDLNVVVNVFDLVGINGAGRYGTGGAADWSQGDFNYDGATNVFDLVAVGGAAVYGQGGYLTSASGSGDVAAVPEPAAAPLMSGIGVAAMLLVRRWRRSTWHGGRRP